MTQPEPLKGFEVVDPDPSHVRTSSTRRLSATALLS
jgi:hypothetical protein